LGHIAPAKRLYHEIRVRAPSHPQADPMRARALRLARAFAAVALLAGASRAAAGCAGVNEERVRVSAVTERGEIGLADGRQARLAGLDIPDPGRGDPANAAQARAWLTSHLVGREIGLRELAARPDRWGRVLADIFTDDARLSSPNSLSLGLLAAGLARVRPEVETRDCLTERLAAERGARADGLGLWTDPYYGVVEATDLDELRQRDGQFAIVEGVVLRVGQGRNRFYLDFGRRGSFTIVVATRQAQAFERAGVAIAALAGVKIRARGAMDDRFGLRMAISGPDEIERISEAIGKSEASPSK
jgi:endonuclease YncB( thermonuclease family)